MNNTTALPEQGNTNCSGLQACSQITTANFRHVPQLFMRLGPGQHADTRFYAYQHALLHNLQSCARMSAGTSSAVTVAVLSSPLHCS